MLVSRQNRFGQAATFSVANGGGSTQAPPVNSSGSLWHFWFRFRYFAYRCEFGVFRYEMPSFAFFGSVEVCSSRFSYGGGVASVFCL